MRAQPLFKAHPFNIEIQLQSLDFLCKRDSASRLCNKRMAQKAGQPRQHRIGRPGLLQKHQSADRIERIEQEMRIELIAQHGKLGAGRFRFQPHQSIRLLLQCHKIIDRVVQRTPPAQQCERDVGKADKALGKGRLANAGIIEPLHPCIDGRMDNHCADQDQRRCAPSEQGLAIDQLAVNNRQNQTDGEACDCRHQNDDQQIKRLAVR